jgi:hypothetical protein
MSAPVSGGTLFEYYCRVLPDEKEFAVWLR